MPKKIIVAAVSLVLAAALFAGVALAQDSAPAKGWFFQAFLEKLAANLGVDQGKLQEALKQTELQMVDEAVQQGRLTSEQAEKIKQRIENGQLFPLGPSYGPRPDREPGFKKGFAGKNLDVLAQALGMSTDELKAQLQQGKKISDLAQEKGLTMEQLRQKLLEAKIQAIQQAVKEGKISQEKADQLIEKMQNMGPHKGWRGNN